MFLFISSRFRRQVKQFFGKQFRRLYRTRITTTIPNRNQVAPEINQEIVSSVNSS